MSYVEEGVNNYGILVTLQDCDNFLHVISIDWISVEVYSQYRCSSLGIVGGS